jgi:hypothetical protein
VGEFDITSFIAKIDQEHEIRVGRVLLSLMRDSKPENVFHTALSPHAMNIPSPLQLKAAADGIMKQIHLDQFASVTINQEGKVEIAIRASDLKFPAAQTSIATMLDQIHEHASQLGI